MQSPDLHFLLGPDLLSPQHKGNATDIEIANCTDGVPWILTVFHQCVLDDMRYAAVICGMVSIIAWLFNGLPQMIENVKSGKAHEAMSIYLLLFWSVGDCLNLSGCILTHQLLLQTLMAIFSIVCDIVLLSQWNYSYLRAKNVRRKTLSQMDSHESRISINETEELPPGTLLACVLPIFSLAVIGGHWQSSLFLSNQVVPLSTGRRLLFYQPIFVSTEDWVGYIMGCLSSACYLSSRIPQLLKNFLRRSTDGLSIGLFLLALLGNATYGAQIFLTSVDLIFILRHFPWILGSLGVLTLDLVMMLQFLVFRNSARLQTTGGSMENDQVPILYA